MSQTYHFRFRKGGDQLCRAVFTVPKDCKGISLRHTLKQPYTMLVILMIRDDKGQVRFQKQLSYSSPIISLGQTSESTTIGGIPGHFTTGEWTIEAIFNQEYGKYFEDKSIDFDITLELFETYIKESIDGPIWVDEAFQYQQFDEKKVYKEGKAWYRGDFHTHTQLSDGKELLKTVTEKVLDQGLDFYVATEHNLLHTGWRDTPLMVLPGMEMTTNYGHANIFGLTKRPQTLDKIILTQGKAQVLPVIDELVTECHRENWLFSINHPFLYKWKWEFDDFELERLNCLEIINDPTYELEPEADGKKANEDAVRLADLLWSQGYRICAIGGSDSHMLKDESYRSASSPSVPGDPSTWLLMDDLTPQHVKESLVACRSYVTRFCSLEMRLATEDGTEVYFGDQLPKQARQLHFQIDLQGEEELDLYYLYNGQEISLESEEIGKYAYRVSGVVDVGQAEYEWIRFGARTKSGDFRLYANPITLGEKKPELVTFSQAKKALGL